jgi:hypothetical protein
MHYFCCGDQQTASHHAASLASICSGFWGEARALHGLGREGRVVVLCTASCWDGFWPEVC